MILESNVVILSKAFSLDYETNLKFLKLDLTVKMVHVTLVVHINSYAP
jgi:hypothetical protein